MKSGKLFILCINQKKSKNVRNYITKSIQWNCAQGNGIQIKTMDTIFLNSENSKISEPHILILKLTDKLYLRRGEKSIALSNLSIYYSWKTLTISYNNNEFEISAPTWNDKFELPDGSYSVSDNSRLFWIHFKNSWRKYW